MDENPNPRETRRLAYEMCRDNVWPDITEDQFQITRMSGGLTNDLYICSHVKAPDNTPQSVLLRVYGPIASQCEFVMQNSVIFALMSEKKLGPKLYGMTRAARIEEHIPAKALATNELQNPTLSRMIARKLASLHSLDMPLRKKPRFLIDKMNEWMGKVLQILETHTYQEQFMKKFRDYNLKEELQTLKEILSRVQSPVVFSHNDLQEGNILYNDELDENRKMVVIDWEYCSYNYRGYDFGNHFLEWTYNYNITSHPNFEYNEENYPSREQQNEFFRAYLQESDEHITDEVLEDMYVEARTFGLASHFFWGLWSILQNETSNIEFGFLEYAVSRFEGYFSMKRNRPKK